MKRIVQFALGLAAAAALYVLVALALVATDSPAAPSVEGAGLDFAASVGSNYDGLPGLSHFPARDGTALGYRVYGQPEGARGIVVLLHGSGWHGMQFHALASDLAARSGIAVLVPDPRGHGPAPARRGDVDYIGQMEDDLADLLDHRARPGQPVVVAGHSAGGGLAVRFAGGAHGHRADAFVLLAPYLSHEAPTQRPGGGGWAHPAVRRIVGLAMLNGLGITALNHLPVIAFAMPPSILEGRLGHTATRAYSYRLNTSYVPRPDYRADLAALAVPTLVVVGAADEVFDATQFQDVIGAQTATATVRIVPDATHIGLVHDPAALALVGDWIEEQL
ncbi:alpha/beta hydrolase [Zavarzinia sp. CC-PAN008]|uniref:alpha/beta hydrolase n=1 Tax=Zavarzinia sp. CC-PAN008 TaxID=3243332 RepID=UPI003F742454